MTESERLKEIRKVLGLTQRELSEALEIKQGSYSDVERGKAGIRPMFIGFQDMNLVKSVEPLIYHMPNGDKTASESHYSLNNLDEQIELVERQQQYLESLMSMVEYLKKR
jgi:transcriptional regulator with XRE-family HTH domain